MCRNGAKQGLTNYFSHRQGNTGQLGLLTRLMEITNKLTTKHEKP